MTLDIYFEKSEIKKIVTKKQKWSRKNSSML